MKHFAAVGMAKRSLASMLAKSFLAGEADTPQIYARASQVLGREWQWLRRLVDRYVAVAGRALRQRHRDVLAFIMRDPDFEGACRRYGRRLSIRKWLIEPQCMQPLPAARHWPLPVIETSVALADWLWLTDAQLAWFADLANLTSRNKSKRVQHYHYRVLAKRTAGLRLIEAPKRRLKAAQKQILSGILEQIPAHPAVHGFLKGRSTRSFAAPHAGAHVLLRMDLRDFFTSIPGVRVQALFRTIGYPERVADLLGGVCTNVVPRETWRGIAADFDTVAAYARPHLPQGAPTSPALANLCAYRADQRLSGLAQKAGATYTRYADDLAFSGGPNFERRVERFAAKAGAILLEEGFDVHFRKTRVMRQGVRQHLAGLVTNEKVNVQRRDFDRLKATLTNSIRHGPDSQNRAAHAAFRAHLEGRVAFVESINPAKAERLRRLFEQIRWGGRQD